jgi:hypothetical protein
MHCRLGNLNRWCNDSFVHLQSATGRGSNCYSLQALGNHLIGSTGAIGATYRTRNGIGHAAINGFHIKGVTLPASTFDFDGGHSIGNCHGTWRSLAKKEVDCQSISGTSDNS